MTNEMRSALREELAYTSTRQQVDLLNALGVDVKPLAIEVFDRYVTERSTDRAIDWLVGHLPFYIKWVAKTALDALLPEHLRGLLFRLIGLDR